LYLQVSRQGMREKKRNVDEVGKGRERGRREEEEGERRRRVLGFLGF